MKHYLYSTCHPIIINVVLFYFWFLAKLKLKFQFRYKIPFGASLEMRVHYSMNKYCTETFWTQNFLRNSPKWPFIETKMWIIFTAWWFEVQNRKTWVIWEMGKDGHAKKGRKMKDSMMGQYKKKWWMMKRVSLFLSSYIPKMRSRVAERDGFNQWRGWMSCSLVTEELNVRESVFSLYERVCVCERWAGVCLITGPHGNCACRTPHEARGFEIVVPVIHKDLHIFIVCMFLMLIWLCLYLVSGIWYSLLYTFYHV